MNYGRLREELTNDPLGRGYAGMTDQQVVDDLTTEYRTLNVATLAGDVIFQQTDPTEFVGLSQDRKVLWLSFCGRAGVDPWATANVEFVKWAFGGQSTTVANLAAARTRTVSRAQEISVTDVKAHHVAHVRAQ